MSEDDVDVFDMINSIERGIENGEITLQQVQQRISNFLDGTYPEVGFFQEVVDKLFIDDVIEISIEILHGEPIYILVAYDASERKLRKDLMNLETELTIDLDCYIEFSNLDIGHYLYREFNILRCEIGKNLWDESQDDIDRYPVYFEHVEDCDECQVSKGR